MKTWAVILAALTVGAIQIPGGGSESAVESQIEDMSTEMVKGACADALRREVPAGIAVQATGIELHNGEAVVHGFYEARADWWIDWGCEARVGTEVHVVRLRLGWDGIVEGEH